jgi:MarR family
VTSWSFLTNHARVLLCIARDPGMRLRDLAASLGITERSAHGIVTDLVAVGYVVKQKDGRRNRYQIQAHPPLPEPTSQEPAVGEVLDLLAGASVAPQTRPDHRSRTQGNAGGPPMRPAGLAGTALRAVAAHEHISHQQASGEETS